MCSKRRISSEDYHINNRNTSSVIPGTTTLKKNLPFNSLQVNEDNEGAGGGVEQQED
jgi:hypothetical protein